MLILAIIENTLHEIFIMIRRQKTMIYIHKEDKAVIKWSLVILVIGVLFEYAANII